MDAFEKLTTRISFPNTTKWHMIPRILHVISEVQRLTEAHPWTSALEPQITDHHKHNGGNVQGFLSTREESQGRDGWDGKENQLSVFFLFVFCL